MGKEEEEEKKWHTEEKSYTVFHQITTKKKEGTLKEKEKWELNANGLFLPEPTKKAPQTSF